MTYKELKTKLDTLTPNQLEKEVIVFLETIDELHGIKDLINIVPETRHPTLFVT